MFPDETDRCKKISTVIGSMLLLLPGGLDLYWGSISVYALSYIVTGLHSTSQIELPVTISLYIIFWCAAGIANGLLSRFFNRRCIMLVGALIINIAMFTSYFAIQSSLVLLDITCGAFIGIGSGLLYGNSIHIVLQTANKDEGLLCSLILTSYPLGGLIVSQMVTLYVNPLNESPDIKVGTIDYFSQPDVISRIPSMFLVLGGFTSVMHFLGFALLQVNPSMRFKDCSLGNSEKLNLLKYDDKAGKQKQTVESGATIDKVNDASQSNSSSENEKSGSNDFQPKDLLKSSTFYVFWVSLFMADFAYILLANFYKLYGQVWIHNDHFLTNLGTFSLFSISLVRVLLGLALDKLDTKNCLIVVLAGMALTTIWYYFTARVDGWLYLFATLTYANLSGATYCCYTTMVAKFFGKTHVATNVALLMSSCLVINLVGPFVIDAILTHLGWFALFASAGSSSLINVLLCFICIP